MDKKLAKFLPELQKKALKAGASDATIIDVFRMQQRALCGILLLQFHRLPAGVPVQEAQR